MNRLLKLSFSANTSQAVRHFVKRNISVTSYLTTSKKSGGDDFNDIDRATAEVDPSLATADEIERIKKYEDGYFTNVKQSFDKLQKSRTGETLEEKRARLLYQSRKRGISENGLLLSYFSAEYLPKMNEKQLNEYDSIINNLHNEWDLYYWMTSAIELPEDIKSNEVIQMMKKYCANELMEKRIVQPNLPPISSLNNS